ncbi:HvnC protein [Luteibacter sp. UNCMF366Tsu5.1]|uniref:HvnC protein n=1 Tax=Luteibacter sp. UNCMF366Tsu5.1 TaxID=1502758 RepID=UPI00090918CC|nr:HvnC protein [Luteibacter sp. UNCMF366Tsu5.1]SFW32616.1 hypothetical protein SAMN02800691_1062 [Luteibacter sp. UNCMF366Tsu5.1]
MVKGQSLRRLAIVMTAAAWLSIGGSALSDSRDAHRDHDAEGIAVAATIQARYDDERTTTCAGSDTAPSFLCSGVILRSTVYPSTGHVWDPKGAANPKPGGISFSWMRRDAQFNKVAHRYAQGFLLVPVLKYGDRPFRNMEVLCAFPIDAASDERVNRGCGAHRDYPTQSRPCQMQGIVTAPSWVAHYNVVSDKFERRNHQCGFTVVSGTTGSSAIFEAVLAAMRAIKDESFGEQNELVIEEWGFGEGTRLPIEAFFYVAGHDGPIGAMAYQRDFYVTTGRWVPVIRLTMARKPGDRATFVYRPEDQAIP